jgi:uncharacterized repeat protein (TIGR01451 family)
VIQPGIFNFLGELFMKNVIYKIVPVLILLSLAGCYSCQTWNHAWGNGPRSAYPEGITFWDKNCKQIVAAAPAPKPMPMPTPKSEPKPMPTGCGPYMVERTYPCSDCGVVRLDKVMPSQVAQNAPFDYEITVTNLTDMLVTDVVVTENLDSNFKFAGASPSARAMENKLVWTMDKLEPRARQTIKVTGSAGDTDCIKNCATITYTVPACASVQVVQPALRLAKTAPSEVLLCEPIPVKITVTNTGTGVASDVKIADTLPEGLMTSDGKRSIMLDAGSLSAGQSKSFSMELKASKTGSYVNKATAMAGGGLKAEASTTTVVRQPVLAIQKSGPQKRYLGRNVTFDIVVTNRGDAPARDTMLEDELPGGTKFIAATDGGELKGSKVVWDLGTLNPGANRKVSLTVMPDAAGTVRNVAKATATCAEGVSAAASTNVTGIPALLLEVVDLVDPVEVGNNTTYVITATNQGSMADTNITIVCTLEENETYVSSSGATRGRLEGNKIIFQPLPSLAPKDKAQWQVVIKAVKAGDVRFTATMTSTQLTRPVEETESTNLYE